MKHFYFSTYILLLLVLLLHDGAFGMFGRGRKLEKGSTSSESFSSITRPLLKQEPQQSFRERRGKDAKSELKDWIDTIYNDKATRHFLMGVELGILEPCLKPYSKDTAKARQLIELFDKKMKKGENERIDDQIRVTVVDVMKKIRGLKGKNDDELAKIAIYAQALAYVSAANKRASPTIHILEEDMKKLVVSLWETHIAKTDFGDDRVKGFLDSLLKLYTCKV